MCSIPRGCGDGVVAPACPPAPGVSRCLLPVDGGDDEGDGSQPQGSGGPAAHGQGPAGEGAQQGQRGGTEPVDGEAGDGHRGQALPHEGVHHGHSHTCGVLRVGLGGHRGQWKDGDGQAGGQEGVALTAAAFRPLSMASAVT